MTRLKAITQPLPLAKMAYEALRDSILTGSLTPGEIYNEMSLAKELGISRTPVREALLELAAQGLVTYLPRKGVMVKHFTKRDVEEIFELREAIELAALEKALKNSRDLDLLKLERSLKDQQKAWKKNDSEGYIQADRSFHLTFCEATNNRRFLNILENIRDLTHLMAVRALDKRGRWEEVIKEHQQILKAIREGKPGIARKTLVNHLKRSEEAVLEHMELEEEGSDVNKSTRQ